MKTRTIRCRNSSVASACRNAPQGRGYDPQPRQGEGSGFIVSADGYILTNAHVVADADEVTVRTTDRREYPAKVIGLDRRTDVAVLKIEGKQLPVVKLGDPSKLRPGEWVLAIGSPFTFENSVTAGIVSATGRAMPGEDLVPFIQTDVAVNPGNSGGPLFNLNGEVVGINSQIYSRSGGYMGLSFAIPIDVANNVRQQIVDNGKVTRGRIGVQIQDVDAEMADAFNLDRPRGALVGDVIEDGPAAKGGVKSGDVILSVNGKGVERSTQLPGVISAIKPGDTAKLEIWRDGKTKTLGVKVEEFQEETQKVANRDVEEPAKADKLGLSVRPLGADERKRRRDRRLSTGRRCHRCRRQGRRAPRRRDPRRQRQAGEVRRRAQERHGRRLEERRHPHRARRSAAVRGHPHQLTEMGSGPISRIRGQTSKGSGPFHFSGR